MQRATDCKLQVVGMPVEVVGKEQRIASCRQLVCQLKLWSKSNGLQVAGNLNAS
jgi:rRNA processing protein Krr1/Pno1